MLNRYFKNVNCIEELKAQYFALAKKYHSDITGGSDEEMKEINAQYDELFKKYKDIHKSMFKETKDGKPAEPYYTAKESTSEAPEEFRNIINALLKMGLNVELCGRWVWITGNTKAKKEELKSLGCRWSKQKLAWSWHYPEDKKKGFKTFDMDKIRNTFGSVLYEAETEKLQLAGC